jgi:hypothetical protein
MQRTVIHICASYMAVVGNSSNYINTAIPGSGSASSSQAACGHRGPDVGQAPQDTLITPEVGKFANILGITLIHEIVDPDDSPQPS